MCVSVRRRGKEAGEVRRRPWSDSKNPILRAWRNEQKKSMFRILAMAIAMAMVLVMAMAMVMVMAIVIPWPFS